MPTLKEQFPSRHRLKQSPSYDSILNKLIASVDDFLGTISELNEQQTLIIMSLILG